MQEPFNLIIKILRTKFNVILQLINTRYAFFKRKNTEQLPLKLSNDISPQ
jgi:hypothetical protein